MNEFILRWRFLWAGKGRPYAALLAFVLVLGGARLGEWLVVHHAENDFEQVVDQRCNEYLETAVQSFADIQRSTRRMATETAGHTAVIAYLSLRDTSHAAIFGAVIDLARTQDVGIEVYDRHGSLVCWEGRSGPRHPRESARGV